MWWLSVSPQSINVLGWYLHFLQVLWSKDKEHKGLTKAAYAKGLACYCALFKKHILIGGLFTTFLATVSCKVVVVLQKLPSYSSH